MTAELQRRQLDLAFARIEETILPCIAMMLDSLLEASELGGTGVMPLAYVAELRMLALQLEALTREIEAVSPARIDRDDYRTTAAA